MIIDFHTHIFPEKVAGAAIRGLSEAAGIPSHTDGTLAGLLRSMEAAGIGRSVTLPVATNPASVPSINNYVLSLREEGALIPFGAMHPRFEGWREELARLQAAGVKGIKLHPDYQDTYVDDPAMAELLACACELGLVSVLHGGDDYAFSETHCTPERVARILPGMDSSRLVIAHYGGNDRLDEVRRYLYGSGVYIDTSFAHAKHPRECGEIIRTYDPRRILFATDSPWDDQKADVAYIRGLGLPPELEHGIFCGNACRLLGLPAPPREPAGESR